MTTCLYIASPSYSGSTLLTMLLGGHPEVATIGEMKGGQEDLTTYACSCGNLFVKCPFWKALIEALKERGYVYDLSDRSTMPVFQMPGSTLATRIMRHAYGGRLFEAARDGVLCVWPGCRRRIAYVESYTRIFIELLLRMKDAKVFLDSSKDPVRIKYLARIPSLDVKVIHLVRDGRGVVNSTRKHHKVPAALAAQEWRDTQFEIERVARCCCRGRILRVRYEDLCAAPDEVLGQVLEFAGLDEHYRVADAAKSEQHVLGNTMRLKGNLAIHTDESWRTELRAADLEAFEKIAGSLNRHFGYTDQAVLVPAAAASISDASGTERP
jgi:hypothetical protein